MSLSKHCSFWSRCTIAQCATVQKETAGEMAKGKKEDKKTLMKKQHYKIVAVAIEKLNEIICKTIKIRLRVSE